MLALDVSAHQPGREPYPPFIAKRACERDLVVALDVLDLHDTH